MTLIIPFVPLCHQIYFHTSQLIGSAPSPIIPLASGLKREVSPELSGTLHPQCLSVVSSLGSVSFSLPVFPLSSPHQVLPIPARHGQGRGPSYPQPARMLAVR